MPLPQLLTCMESAVFVGFSICGNGIATIEAFAYINNYKSCIFMLFPLLKEGQIEPLQ